MTRLVLGMLALNLAFLAVGYAFVPRRASWAGVALLAGAGTVGTALFFAAIAGMRVTLVTAALVTAALLGARLLLSRLVPEEPTRASIVATVPARGESLAAALLGVVAAICAFALVGGFRSSPWLDDAWGIWLPKGMALWHLGLDERLFVPNATYVAFEVPEYPLWWSAIASLGVQAVGSIDLRAMNAQLAILAVAFVAAVARLMWGWVRPTIVAAALVLLCASPELWRHSQGGIADLPLAIYLALGALCGAGWIALGSRFHLVLAALFTATALQIKTEALPQVALLLALGLLVACGRRIGLALAGGVALASAVPWYAWRVWHEIPSRIALADALSPAYLGDRSDRIRPAARAVGEHLLDPREWFLLAPLAIALGLVGFVRTRRPTWLASPAAVALLALFLVWAYWADRDAIEYVLATSSYRVVDSVVLVAAVLAPLQAERLLR